MKLRVGKGKTSIFYLIIVFGVYLFYYLADMRTNANVMVKQTESRGSVHVFMFLLIGILALYFVFHMKIVPNLGITVPLICITGWIVCVDIINGSSIWNIAVRVGLFVLWWLISFFAARYTNSQLRYSWVLKFEFIIWGITVFYSLVSIKNYAAYSGSDEANVLNISYNILVLIPFLMQLKNKYLRGITNAISVFLIIVSMKRGAILAMGAMLLVFFYIKQCMCEVSWKRRKLVTRLVVIAILVCVCVILVDAYSGGFLSSRFTKEALLSGSNRSELYNHAWQDIRSRSILQLIIGKGSSSVLQIIGSGVHNEFLEFLFSYGVVGCLLYLILIVKGIKTTIYMTRKKKDGAPYYGMAMTFIVIVGFVGSALFSHYTFHIMLLIGLSYKGLKN